MEIDFLGLKSPRYDIEHEGSNNGITDAANGGVETSLSLSTSSSLDFHREILNFSENKKKKKKWEFGGNSDKMIPSCSGSSSVCSLGPYNHENSNKVEQHSLLLVATPVFHRPSATGFLYDLNDTAAAAAAASFRNISELPATSLPMLYSPPPNIFKAKSSMYIAGNASTGLSRSGNYTPTVAMARRATLARFLEKRLHRINQARTSHIMARSVNGTHSETCETSITKSNNKKKNNLLKRRS